MALACAMHSGAARGQVNFWFMPSAPSSVDEIVAIAGGISVSLCGAPPPLPVAWLSSPEPGVIDIEIVEAGATANPLSIAEVRLGSLISGEYRLRWFCRSGGERKAIGEVLLTVANPVFPYAGGPYMAQSPGPLFNHSGWWVLEGIPGSAVIVQQTLSRAIALAVLAYDDAGKSVWLFCGGGHWSANDSHVGLQCSRTRRDAPGGVTAEAAGEAAIEFQGSARANFVLGGSVMPDLRARLVRLVP